LSFFETAADQSVRLGAGDASVVLERPLTSPGLQLCVREPERVEFRLRFGTAELTESGIVDLLPTDESERRGVWSASYPTLAQALKGLRTISLSDLRVLVRAPHFQGWTILNMADGRIRPFRDGEPGWSDWTYDAEFLQEVLVRFSGEPDQISALLEATTA